MKIPEHLRERYRDMLGVPKCVKCGKLFNLGFSQKEESLVDYLICLKNDLICNCENYKEIERLIKSKKDGFIDIRRFYL